jgi:hypothetical protein
MLVKEKVQLQLGETNPVRLCSSILLTHDVEYILVQVEEEARAAGSRFADIL